MGGAGEAGAGGREGASSGGGPGTYRSLNCEDHGSTEAAAAAGWRTVGEARGEGAGGTGAGGAYVGNREAAAERDEEAAPAGAKGNGAEKGERRGAEEGDAGGAEEACDLANEGAGENEGPEPNEEEGAGESEGGDETKRELSSV